MSDTTAITFPDPTASSGPALILGTLAQLKLAVLPRNQQAGTEYDAALQAIGKGVAEQLQQHCNREFVRLNGAVDTFFADRRHWVTRRYPLEAVTSVETFAPGDASWETETGAVASFDGPSGLVQFDFALGTERTLVRLTYSGGYWVDETLDSTGTLPAGATELPSALKLAWILQCQAVWSVRDNVGAASLTKKDYEAIAVSKLLHEARELAPTVRDLINPYRRLG